MQVLGDAVEATKSLNDDKLADYICARPPFKTIMGDVKFGKNGEWAQVAHAAGAVPRHQEQRASISSAAWTRRRCSLRPTYKTGERHLPVREGEVDRTADVCARTPVEWSGLPRPSTPCVATWMPGACGRASALEDQRPSMLLPTCLVGSYPQPDWLIDRERLSKAVPRVRAHDLWRVAPDLLEEAQDDATMLAIRDQERAGLDIITDGEQRRESYSNRFATALDGIDLEHPGTTLNRTGRHRHRAARGRHDPAPASRSRCATSSSCAPHTDRPIKIDGAGPVHHVGAVPGRFLRRRRERSRWTTRPPSMPRSRICSPPAPTSCRSTSRGCSRVSEKAQRLRHQGARPRARRRRPARPRCTSASATPRWCTDKPSGYSFLPELERSAVGQVSIEAAQPRLDLSVLQATAVEDHHPRRDRPRRHDGRDARDRGGAHPPGAAARAPPSGSWWRRTAGMKYLAARRRIRKDARHGGWRQESCGRKSAAERRN